MSNFVIWFHLIAALLAILLGSINLSRRKGTIQHRVIGWVWLVLMTVVTLSSFGIRELNPGQFSWIHILTVWTIISMAVALIAIKNKKIRLHARFMIGTMIGAVVAGLFALAPGRFISTYLGYG